MFDLSRADWKFINTFAGWFSAAGTLIVAVVALYIANRSIRPKVRVWVGHRISIGPGSKEPYPEFIVFGIVNQGERPLAISQIGWKVGLLNKRHAIQQYEESMSSKLPVYLAHGEEATWYVPLDARVQPWMEFFAKGMLMPNYKVSCLTLRAQFFSSIGQIFSVKPERTLIVKLKETCENLARSS
ncbi:MAG: hypothetical protein JRC93_08550 [Deltaproteobacteria bacterium]|nr:hypothetical protein [Deltaproteobacteria bacterium]